MDWQAKARALFPADDTYQALQRRAFLVGVGFGIERAAQLAEGAQLPEGYQWGRDAMEQFNFGKQRAALAIRADEPELKS